MHRYHFVKNNITLYKNVNNDVTFQALSASIGDVPSWTNNSYSFE